MDSAPGAVSVSLYDARPFFEKALQHGLQHGILDQARLDAIAADASKGMVQIARYFGTEFLRPELEKARERMVNLVSLYLESHCGGDLRAAAESLRDHSFLSRSKGGSDMLKALIAMPQNSHFGMNERLGFRDEHIPVLAKWSLRSLADYRAELALRQQVAHVMDAAVWMAARLNMDEDELEEAGPDAEAVVRTALLAVAGGLRAMPDWAVFEKTVLLLRKKFGAAGAVPLQLPQGLPAPLHGVVQGVLRSMAGDWARILDPQLAVRKLFDQTPAFMGRYFWVEGALAEVDAHERRAGAAWHKATGGSADDGALLTLFLCVAAGASPQTVLTEKAAATLVRKIQKSGMKPELADCYIAAHAPRQHQSGYLQLWKSFVDEAQATLQSDAAYALNDALALLRRECHVKSA